MLGGVGSSGLIWLRGGGSVRGDTFANLSMIDLDYIEQGKIKMGNAWLEGDMDEMIRASRDDMVRPILKGAWVIPWPSNPSFNFWQPWLKNYYGVTNMGSFAGPPIQYVWIDQELKKEMGY